MADAQPLDALSSVEEMAEASVWKHVRTFVEAYGADLFHAKLLTLGNVRTILDAGIEGFLDYLDDSSDELHPVKLLEDLYGGAIDSERAMTYLEMIYESVVDKFDRYVEYNTTTTHSDYGEKFYCLLDFLRAESAYERDAWNLSPIGVCHELFSECGRHAAARAWEEDFRARSAPVASKHLIRLRSLEKKYGMRLPSISDRLAEQFVKPLAVNRMRALLPGALRNARLGRGSSPPSRPCGRRSTRISTPPTVRASTSRPGCERWSARSTASWTTAPSPWKPSKPRACVPSPP